MIKAKDILIITGLSIALLGGLWFFFHGTNKQNTQNIFSIEQPSQRDLVQYITTSGTLKARDEITVGSLVAGRVIKIVADDNDIVKKDDILAILDDGIGDSNVKRQKGILKEAQANLDFQEALYQRQKALYLSGQLAKNSFEQIEQNYKVSQARVQQAHGSLEVAEKQYDNLFIKSPDNGIVIAKLIDLGQMITAQFQATVLYKIARDLHHMEAELDVDEADVGSVKEGQEATFTVDSFPREEFTGMVKQIRYQAKIVESVVTYATVLDIKNPDLKLRPGMTTNVEIKIAEAKKALCIPNKALRVSRFLVESAAKKNNITISRASGKTKKKRRFEDFIWVMDNHDTVREIRVEIGINDGKYSQVLSGITSSDMIITDVDASEGGVNILQGMLGGPGQIGK